MIDGVTATAQSQANSQLQASLIAVRSEAQNQQQIAQTLSEQAQKAQDQVPQASNPQGVGENVDTFA